MYIVHNFVSLFTADLHGSMQLLQNNKTQDGAYVANNSPVNHIIALTEPDAKFLKEKATQIITYWFVDCKYYGQTEDMSFQFSYEGSDKSHDVEAPQPHNICQNSSDCFVTARCGKMER